MQARPTCKKCGEAMKSLPSLRTTTLRGTVETAQWVCPDEQDEDHGQ